jgi:hypothetical protein
VVSGSAVAVKGKAAMSAVPSPADRLANPDAHLTRSDLAALGLPRGAVDAVFRRCPVVVFEGYSRPMILVADFLAYRERCTFRGDRVRPS